MSQRTRFSSVIILLALVGVLTFLTATAQADTKCKARKSWVDRPDPPQEIPDGGQNFCQFYQFSWQWFLQLVSPSAEHPELRNFQVKTDYPVLQGDEDGRQVDSCSADSESHALFVRINKSRDPGSGMLIPERIHQAGDNAATIYDQNGNVVFYEIRFSRNLCDVGSIQVNGNYPGGTTEMKTAWRMIDENQKPDYFWIEADIQGVGDSVLLGLIGFHLVRNTDDHPEFVWATFEHKANAPDCTKPQAEPDGGWSFTSSKCAGELSDGTLPKDCHFNEASSAQKLTGKPSEVCRVYRDGTKRTKPSDPKAKENLHAIDQLNEQLVGAKGILTGLPAQDPMAVWKNYFIVGALWVSDPTQPSSIDNQRGSLRLANTVMETTYQNVDTSQSFVSNCFGCHNYQTSQSNTLPSASLSHSFDNVVEGQCANPTDVDAGPIWSNDDAQTKCPTVCENNGGWNGQWTTTVPGIMSVCGCCQVTN